MRHDRGDDLVHQQRRPPPPRNTPSLTTAGLMAASAKKPEQERADEPADEVHAHHVEAVVEAERLLEAERQVAHRAGDQADVDGRHAADEAGARRDRHQAGDRARGGAEGRGVAVLEALDDEPAEHGGRGGEEGVHDRLGGDAVGGQRRAGVEPGPAEPQDAGAEQRSAAGCAAASASSGQPLRWPSRSTRARAAAPAFMWTTAPPAKSRAPMSASQPPREDHVGDRRVHQHQPHADEHGVGAELEAVGRGPGDQRRRDDGERHLVGAEQDERDGQGQRSPNRRPSRPEASGRRP